MVNRSSKTTLPKLWIPHLRHEVISDHGHAMIVPTDCRMPAMELGDTMHLVTQGLIALQKQHCKAIINLTSLHTEALQQLADMFEITK